jgi:hypothetical protein
MSKEEFSNRGDTKREREVANLLNKKIPGHIIMSVRFAGWSDSSSNAKGQRFFVSVDLAGGGVIPGGYVDDEMSAKQQAEDIYENISNLATGL